MNLTCTVENKIENYVLENVNISELDPDRDIIESGLVNSLFTIELMTFLERTFSIKVTMDDLDMENFKSINCIAAFVRNKRMEK